MRASLKDLEVTQVSQDVTFLLCQLISKYSKYRGSCQALGNLSDLPLAPRVSAGWQTQGSSHATVCVVAVQARVCGLLELSGGQLALKALISPGPRTFLNGSCCIHYL